MPVKSHYKKGKTTSGSSADAVVPQLIKKVQWIFFQQKYWDKEINRSLQVKYSENFHLLCKCSALVYWSQISPACFSQFSFYHFAFKTSIVKFWKLGNIPMVKSKWVYKHWTSRLLKINLFGVFAEEFFVILQHILNLSWIQVNSLWFATSCHLVIHSILRYL